MTGLGVSFALSAGSVVCFRGMNCLDNGLWARSSEVRDQNSLHKLETLTGKTVASPYFAANDFAFAYAKA